MLWLAAVVLDYGLVLIRGVEGWHVHAKHFAERFALVMIIALGESIVAIGVGAAGVELGAAEVVAALLARRRSRARCGGRTSTSSRSSPSTASRRRSGSRS